MRKTFFLLGLFFCVAAAFSNRLSAQNAAPESYQSDAEKLAVIEQIEKAGAAWNDVDRWLIHYDGKPVPATSKYTSIYRIMAVAAPGELYHMGAHFDPQPWEEDPFCQDYFVHNGKTCHRFPFSRAYSEGVLKAGQSIPGSLPGDVLLTVIPRWPLTTYKPPVGKTGALVLPQVLREEYRLLTRTEVIAGEPCVIFEKDGVDQIWIAAEKGVCVMKRDIRSPKVGKLLQRYLTDKVSEFGKGRWMPTEFRNQFFSAPQKDGVDVMTREYMLRVLRCDLNDQVPASTFIPAHRPGSLRYANDDFQQVSPGGEDLMSEIVNFMGKYKGLPEKRAASNQKYLWLMAGLGIGLCLATLTSGRKKAERKSNEARSVSVEPETAMK